MGIDISPKKKRLMESADHQLVYLNSFSIFPWHTVKEKRWVIFKGEDDPTSLPVEWICWLSGQRKKAPTPQEMIELDVRRERVKLNVALLKEEEERKSKYGSLQQSMNTGNGPEEDMDATNGTTSKFKNSEATMGRKSVSPEAAQEPESSEPTGSGASFKPGTWQPPT
ncbi:NADH:ubiquinone oxidoreductase, 17.2kDa subunit isoform X2 [Tasmannia lanceolata]|uniref:NADH:ubiquinone oxidoreductase, 17.2kDa subunit isoform X2 n=1 Tax=Tasmannia lanceolata TaxID=3420 RepID=UPI004063CCB1